MKKLTFYSTGRFNNFLRSDTEESKKFLENFNRYMLKFLLEDRDAFIIKNWFGDMYVYNVKGKKFNLDGDLKDIDLVSEEMTYTLKDGKVITSKGGYKFLGFLPTTFSVFTCQSDATHLDFLPDGLEYFRDNTNVYNLIYDPTVRKEMYRLDIERHAKNSLELNNLFVAASNTPINNLTVEKITVFDNEIEEVC